MKSETVHVLPPWTKTPQVHPNVEFTQCEIQPPDRCGVYILHIIFTESFHEAVPIFVKISSESLTIDNSGDGCCWNLLNECTFRFFCVDEHGKYVYESDLGTTSTIYISVTKEKTLRLSGYQMESGTFEWIYICDKVPVVRSLRKLIEQNDELKRENQILHELIDRPDGAGCRFSYQECAKVIGL